MKKEIKNGQGFICKDLNEKIRIWEKLIQHRYPMFAEGNDPRYKHIVWDDGEFVETNQNNIEPLNEAEFFDENEWTPKAGEWVEAMNIEGKEFKRRFMCTLDGVHYLFSEVRHSKEFCTAKNIRKIQPETMTIKEAQEKLRKLLNKPNLTIIP
jgi:hypothetical protein